MPDMAQQRGPITDLLGAGPNDEAVCLCVHGKTWLEGDRFEQYGGKSCEECVTGAVIATEREERPQVLAGDLVWHVRTGRWRTAGPGGVFT